MKMEYRIKPLDYVNECKNENREILYKDKYQGSLSDLIGPENWNTEIRKILTETKKELDRVNAELKAISVENKNQYRGIKK